MIINITKVSEEDKTRCLELMKAIEFNLKTTTKQYKTLLDSIIQDDPNPKKVSILTFTIICSINFILEITR